MLTDRVLKWAIDAVHPAATVLAVEPLPGGTSSLIHRVTLMVDGERKPFVLRQFNNAEWLHSEPDLARHEAACLERASRISGVRTPDMIAFDETGERCGTPAVWMTHLEGQVVLQPPDMSGWLDGMAQALVRIHAGDSSDLNDFPWTYYSYCNAAILDTSTWSRHPDKWRLAAEFVQNDQPAYTKRFIHRDYHPANVLWSGDEVSGVVDWVNGCVGPAGIDVGHCRVNLAQLYGVEAADEFMRRYCKYAGDSFVYDRYWDLLSLLDVVCEPPDVYPGWTALGVNWLSRQMVTERLDAYLTSLLDQPVS